MKQAKSIAVREELTRLASIEDGFRLHDELLTCDRKAFDVVTRHIKPGRSLKDTVKVALRETGPALRLVRS